MREQAEQQVARRAVRRLRAGGKEQPEEGEDLLVGEALPVELGGGEDAHEIVRGVDAPVGEHAGEVVAQLRRGSGAAFPVERHADELDRPAMELREVLAGEPEHAGDHVDRERQRELAHELCLAAVDECFDALVDDRSDGFFFPAFHRLAAERLLHEPAVGVVLGLVHLEDGVAHHRAHDVGVAGRRERLAVAQNRLHGVVAERGEDLGSRLELGLGVRSSNSASRFSFSTGPFARAIASSGYGSSTTPAPTLRLNSSNGS